MIFKTHHETIINSRADSVYAIAEQYPMFMDSFCHKELVSASPRDMDIRAGIRVLGINIYWSGYGRKTSNVAINFTQTCGLFKGLEASWRFVDLSGQKTRFSITTFYKVPIANLRLPILFFAHYLLLKPTTAKILNTLKTRCESRWS